MVDILKKCLLFRDIDIEKLTIPHQILNLQPHTYIENKLLNERYIGILLEGEVLVKNCFIDGNSITIKSILPADMFGICNLFFDEDIPSVLETRSYTKVFCIKQSDMLNLFKLNEKLLSNYTYICNKKIIFLNKKIQFYNIKSPLKKLAYYILSNSKNGKVNNYFNKTQLADFLGVSRASLYREISTLKSLNCIDLNNNSFIVLDISKLKMTLLD